MGRPRARGYSRPAQIVLWWGLEALALVQPPDLAAARPMLRVYHYHSVDGLMSCFVLTAQLHGGNGSWTGGVLYNRYDSPTASEMRNQFKRFGSYPSEAGLLADIHEWIRHSLFEHWTSAEMLDPG